MARSHWRLAALLSYVVSVSLVCGVTDPIIVVGAGLSGLGAALLLAEQGFSDITVLEARNRTGGRTFTDFSLGAPAEMGAGWIHGINRNPVYERCADAGIDVKQFSWEDSDMWDENGNVVSKSVRSELAEDLSTLKKAVAKYVVEQAHPRAGSSPHLRHMRKDWPHLCFNSSNGAGHGHDTEAGGRCRVARLEA
jgi:monoamine oxidase